MGTPIENPEMEKTGVRFAVENQEIAPDQSLEDVEPSDRKREDLNPEAQQELAQLKTTLQNNIQSSRMQHHSFEPVSLPGSMPASRVHSGAATPSGVATPSRRHLPAGSTEASPRPSPPTTAVHSPPLTPAATKSRDGKPLLNHTQLARPVPDLMTPQRSTSPQRAPTSVPQSEQPGGVPAHPKQGPRFSIGPSGDSEPPSSDVSPSSTAPGTPAIQPASHSRQQSTTEQRFRFGNRDPAQGFTSSGSAPLSMPSTVSGLPRSTPGSTTNLGETKQESKRSSFFGSSKKHDDDSGHEKPASSKSNLKRFFKIGEYKHKDKEREREKEAKRRSESRDGTRTPTNGSQTPTMPFADDHGLASKYGKFGKILGSGAGGSVRLMKRTGDGTTFAVKQFRDRHAYESEREYNKKVTAEFCIGSTLHHGNVIETIDIVHEKGKWYEVMEYAPFDLFATVMTGKMTRDEITCATLQIISGVCYLHQMGLAHRDLKLDNVVINEHGIMKLIDFGSAVVFRYPFENEVVLATGVVGSDPYLAPEVYDNQRYDPRPADIWSIAIIFCCMTLRRFPWKAPRISDNSYRLFVSPPDPEQDRILEAQRRSITPHTHRNNDDSKRGTQSEPASRNPSAGNNDSSSEQHHKHHHHHNDQQQQQPRTEPASRQSTNSESSSGTIKGPMRLLRLLPRETRHIIGRMLELDPRKRATMDEVLADPWVQNALVCRQEENGQVFRAPGHAHALQPGGGSEK
ncbi:hypothetical protein Q7P37_006729 [Cladosporium fusiforme]